MQTIPTPRTFRAAPTSKVRVQTTTGDLVYYDGYGSLNAWWQEPVLKHFIKGRHVYDLGAGFLYYAHKLTQLGTARVTAVDKLYADRNENCYNDCRAWAKCAPPGVVLDDRYFSEFHLRGPRNIDVAFVSWPLNTYSATMGLELICERANTVIYLGTNFNGTSCGSQPFWHLREIREVLAYAPGKQNSLIVYGTKRSRRRQLPEEKAAMDQSVYYDIPAWFP